jgi:hypothetical protein
VTKSPVGALYSTNAEPIMGPSVVMDQMGYQNLIGHICHGSVGLTH